MKIKWATMLGTNHSWSFVSQYLIRAMKKVSDHDIYLKSTNNLDHFPEDLKENLLYGYHGYLQQGPADYLNRDREVVRLMQNKALPEISDPNGPYDIEFAYTAPIQWGRRFNKKSRMRAAIWNYESSIMPPGFHLYHMGLDYVLPSSQYCFDVFNKNGIPKDKMLVVPHGVDTEMFNPGIKPFKFKTEKKIKFLHNAIPHYRKLHERVIGGYLDAFTGDDDVCLVLKTKFINPNQKDRSKIFERDLNQLLMELYSGRNNPPEIEVITDFVDDIGSLYTGVDAVVSMSASEGFWMPGLEALACGALVIAPDYSGQTDFLNNDNSLLVKTPKEMHAPHTMQYWSYMKDSVVGDPDTKHFSELLRRVYENPAKEKERVRESAKKTVEEFSWEAAAQMMLDIPVPKESSKIPKKRQVLYIIPYDIMGGGEVWVRDAIKQLDRNLYEPYVALVSSNSEKMMNLFSDVGAKVISLSGQGRGYGLKAYIEANSFSVIHFYNSFSIYNILKDAWGGGLRARIVETVHSELKWQDSMTKVSKRYGFVSKIISVSNHMANILGKKKNDNIDVMPQPIEWDRFRKERSKEILKKHNIPTGFVVGFVGRISPEKNVLTILKSAQYLKDVSFVIIGDGPEKEKLQNISKKLKNVYWLGRKDNIEEYYPSFDVLTLTSDMEGLPLVLLEAMASGTPCISSSVGAISEIIQEGYSGGLLFNNKDEKALVGKIKQMRNKDYWKTISNNCIEVVDRFEKQCELNNINSIYNSLF